MFYIIDPDECLMFYPVPTDKSMYFGIRRIPAEIERAFNAKHTGETGVLDDIASQAEQIAWGVVTWAGMGNPVTKQEIPYTFERQYEKDKSERQAEKVALMRRLQPALKNRLIMSMKDDRLSLEFDIKNSEGGLPVGNKSANGQPPAIIPGTPIGDGYPSPVIHAENAVPAMKN